MTLLMNEFGEFVEPEPPCAYPRLAAIRTSRFRPEDMGVEIGFGRFERVCPECGTRFKTTSPRRVTCSATCTRKRKIRQQKELRAERRRR